MAQLINSFSENTKNPSFWSIDCALIVFRKKIYGLFEIDQ